MRKIFVFVFCFVALTLAFLGINHQIYIKTVIAYDIRQIEALSVLYEEFIKESKVDIANNTILLGEDCFNNFVTGESYSESMKKMLKLAQIKNEGIGNTYYAHVHYDIKNYTLTLSLENDSGYHFSEDYLIYVKKDVISYKKAQ